MVPFESIWPQVAPLVAKAERPSRYINHEWGSVYKPEAGFRFCMVYPDTYELGQANQALRILVNAVNARDGMVAERGFLPAPDMCDALRRVARLPWVMRSSNTSRVAETRLVLRPYSNAQPRRARRLPSKRGASPRILHRSTSLARWATLYPLCVKRRPSTRRLRPMPSPISQRALRR